LRCHRFLSSVWDYCHAHAAVGGDADGRAQRDPEQGRDVTEHLRQRLAKWSHTAVQRITADMEGLEMHTAVRDVMRLFERIRDFEKRVLQRQGELRRADRAALLEALALLCQLLAPLAPHIAEHLWIELGNDPPGAQTPWPRVSFEVPA
jgi:leucyl-tRNA synthetase